MNPSATIPSPQMIFSWTLLGVLLAWTCFFAFLALRGRKEENREAAELPTPSGAFPAIVSQAPLRRTPTPADRSFSPVPGLASEAAKEVGSTPVA
jgi:hypothetical protein